MNDSRKTEDTALAELLGQVYAEAPLTYRRHMVEHLLKPLGILALISVANGLFARIAWKNGWLNLKIRQEDLSAIETHHIVALAQRVQHVSVGTIESLGQVLLSSPVLAGSAATAMLISVLHNQSEKQGPGNLDSDT